MAYEALYRRYRPGRFADVTGQQHVMQALRNAVAHDRVGHAYMFSGPRGTGKTTSARILAKALNCTNRAPGDGEPCDVCPSCLNFQAGTSYDLRELDAASNNGVEAMRDLISKVGLSAGGHGVFILDEAHMLSTGAENALLKTLEEPPPNVTFILCTTEPNKVVPTIRSRTQHFDFSLLSGDELDGLVREVLTSDGVELADDDIDYVVRAGRGSARDTLSALDQVIAAGGAPQAATHGEALLQALADGDTSAVLVATHETLKSGRDPELVGRDLLGDLRNAFLAIMRADLSHLSESDRADAQRWAEAFSPSTITRAVELLGTALVSMRQAPDPRVDLEVALVRLTRPELDTDLSALVSRIERLEAGSASIPAGSPVPSASSASSLDATPREEAAAAPAPDAALAATDDEAVGSASIPDESDGAPAVPAPAAAAPPPAETAPPPAAAAPAPAATAPAPVATAPPPDSTPTAPPRSDARPAAAAGKRPADAARQTLRKVKGETAAETDSAPSPDSAPKQTIGSMRGTATPRGVDSADEPQAAAEPQAMADPPRSAGDRAAEPPGAPQPDSAPPPTTTASPEPDTASESAPPPATATGSGPMVDRATAEAAWEDGLLDSLPGNVKARFSAAVFVDGPPDSLYLALPNEIHRQRCEDVRQPVDDAFAQRFGHPVPLRLVTEGTPVPGSPHGTEPSPGSGPSPSPGAPPHASDQGLPNSAAPSLSPSPSGPPASTPSSSHDQPRSRAEVPPTEPSAAYDLGTGSSSDPYLEEAIDMSALTDATNVSSSVIDRIAEAFPGTELITEED